MIFIGQFRWLARILKTGVVAMTDPGGVYDYPHSVRLAIQDENIDEYVDGAAFLNNAGFDVVSLQHEYGIFGGQAGGNIIELLSRLKMPVVTTLHTVLAKPTPAQHGVMQRIIDISSKVVVMSEKGRQLLHSAHDVPASKVEIIAHGIPDMPFRETHDAKAKLGFTGKTVILTFGLLSPNKGIEIMLDAMPGIIKSCPNAVYVILGATHPNLVRQQGEAYRDSLMERVRHLGIQDHVVFFNQFVERATLLDFISMCDVYVTPYLNEAQMTSGTLAYSFGLGKAVVSTPYWHAKELLSDGRGILVPFGDSKAISNEIAALLTNDVRRHAMRKRAYAASRSMTWPETAEDYLAVFESARAHSPNELRFRPRTLSRKRTQYHSKTANRTFPFALRQHGHTSTRSPFGTGPRPWLLCGRQRPRAAVLKRACKLRRNAIAVGNRSRRLLRLSFSTHGIRTRVGFRNFMGYDRRWLEEIGLGRQPCQNALGFGGMRTHRHRSVSPYVGCGTFQDRSSRRREVLVSARLGLLAPGFGRLLHIGNRRCVCEPHAQAIGRQVDGVVSCKSAQGLALV